MEKCWIKILEGDNHGERRETCLYIGNTGEIPVGEAKKFFYLVGDEKETKRPGLYILKKNSSHTMDYVPISKPKLDWNSHTGKIRCAMHDGMYDPKTERPFIGMPKDPLKKIEPHKYFFKRYISKIMYIQAV